MGKVLAVLVALGLLYFYIPAPMVSSISPDIGLNNQVVSVTLTGDKFDKAATVKLAKTGEPEIIASDVQMISKTEIKCSFNLKGGTVGPWDVVVANQDTYSKKDKESRLRNGFTIENPALLPNGFLVMGEPTAPLLPPKKLTVDSITPNKGFNNGFVLTDITGTNFDEKASVKLRGANQLEIPGLNIKESDSSKINCFFEIASQPVGRYDVVVTNPDGEKATLAGAFSIEVFVPAAPDLNQMLVPIYFDVNKSTLRANQISRLQRDLKILKSNPNLFILLGGHADERGTREYNLDLSARRAQTIKKYLIQQDIQPGRFYIYAYGKEFPVKNGHSESSWWHNRRVDIMVWEAPPHKMQGIKN
jgi:outer membrane protein OmpA-like peptidoglycan-associated protein